MGGKYPNQAFSAVVFRERQAVFCDLTRYDGKIVDVAGTVRMYRGKPEIILIDPSELRAK
jgi:DNA/RNA endonuclease YhcR with UshA esterase domain